MISIRTSIFSDIPELSKLAEETFYDKWREFNSEEDMQLFISQHFTHDILKKEIADEKCFFLLAYFENNLAGYCKLKENNSKIELKNYHAAELEKLYVKKEFQSKKIGEQLLQNCFDEAARKKYEIIWLSVWKPNVRAIKFYERHGFSIIGEQEFLLGKDVQFDFLMSRKI